jgi:hypothetical protein
VYVKNGVANICDKKFAMRFSVDAPDGRYNISYDGGLLPATYDVTLGCFVPFDLEMVRPPFESMSPFCRIENPDPTKSVLTEFFPIIQIAMQKQENIYIDKRGLGLKRSGDIFFEYPFNTPHIIEVNPLYLHVAFTDALRYGIIEMYQEIRPDQEEPNTPLVIGHGWSNCSIIMPIIDRHRHCYSRDD